LKGDDVVKWLKRVVEEGLVRVVEILDGPEVHLDFELRCRGPFTEEVWVGLVISKGGMADDAWTVCWDGARTRLDLYVRSSNPIERDSLVDASHKPRALLKGA
jgi:hypothetical protein